MMKKKLKCIMLIDDNADDNFFHERVIRKNDFAESVISFQSASDGLAYLKNRFLDDFPYPELIFLDINMPGMDGWEFLEEYEKMPVKLKSSVVVMMLTTSISTQNAITAKQRGVEVAFKSKPLTKEMMDEVLDKFFK